MAGLPEAESIRSLESLGGVVADALGALRNRGLIPGPPDPAENMTLLDHLGLLATQPLAEGFHRTALVAGVARELADPTLIRQRSWKTCAATAVQLWLALRRPADYVRLVRGLAAPKGKTSFASGAPLRRCAGTENDDGSGRSASCRLVQAAFMEFGNEGDRYSNARDRSFPRRGPHYAGLFPDQFDGLLEAATGREWETLEISEINAAQAVAAISAALAAETLVPVTLGSGRRKHKILVDRGGADGFEGLDPAGKRVRFEPEAFRRFLRCVSLPTPASVEMSEAAGGAGQPWVRLRTMTPAIPDTCPGCGRPARYLTPIDHPEGRIHVSLCGRCAESPFARVLGNPYVLAVSCVAALGLTAPDRGVVILSALALAAASAAAFALLFRHRMPVELVGFLVDPPRLEVTARNRRWLSRLARLNPGSSRSYLERW